MTEKLPLQEEQIWQMNILIVSCVSDIERYSREAYRKGSRTIYIYVLEMWNVSETKEENYEQYKTPANFTMPSDGYLIPYEVSFWKRACR